MRRRRLLAATGTAILAPIGGCLESDSDDTSAPENDTDDTSDSDGGSDDTSADDSQDVAEADGDDATGEDDGTEEDSTEDGDDTEDEESSEADWPSGPYADYDSTDLTVRTPDGESLGTVHAALALTGEERFLGLSDAESLPEDGGMLFVFDSPDDLTFVMRRMDFGIDIVYADEDRRITGIHHAPAPGPDEDGNEQRYPGYGQYVLEVNYEWTTRHGVSEGDVLDFELPSDF